MADSGSNRRQKAAAARDAANAGEKRRERTVRIVGAVTVVVIVGAIIGLAVFARNSASTEATGVTATADPNAPLPTGVLPTGDQYEYGVVYGTASSPVMEIWEDFQCPACGKLEAASGAAIGKLAEDGKVKLIWRPTTFLDNNLNNDSSVRAVAAWGCAIDAGRIREYHDTVYKNQPEKEGDGYTDQQLIDFGAEAGITGSAADTFTQCVKDATYLSWAANSTKVFLDAGIPGTPLVKLDGRELGFDILTDPAKLEQAVADAAKQ